MSYLRLENIDLVDILKDALVVEKRSRCQDWSHICDDSDPEYTGYDCMIDNVREDDEFDDIIELDDDNILCVKYKEVEVDEEYDD